MVVYLRCLGVASESAVLAAASGPFSHRAKQARLWAEQQIPGAQVEVTLEGSEVLVLVSTQVEVFGGSWRPNVSASARAVRVDLVAWS